MPLVVGPAVVASGILGLRLGMTSTSHDRTKSRGAFAFPRHEDHPWSGLNPALDSLFRVKNSLSGVRKFPAPLRREFNCKPLKLLANWAPKSAEAGQICKIACRFPCYQGIWGWRPVRSGLHPPPRIPVRTDVPWSLTNSPQFAG